MYLIFENALHDVKLLLEISGEGMKSHLGFVEERHDCALLWSDREADSGVTIKTGIREFKGMSVQVAIASAFRKLKSTCSVVSS